MSRQGEQAPDFELPTDSHGALKLKDLRGAPVVLYFYPKDNTKGCTTEAVDFTSKLEEFNRIGVKVVGVSPDSVQKHQNFRDKHNLGIILAADEDKAVAERYGVWAEKKMYGRTYMGIIRTTLLIDKDGVIAQIWPKVRVAGHAQKVLDAARELIEG